MNHKSATPPPLETKIEEIKEGAEMSVDIDGKRYEDVGAILSDFLPGRLDEKIRLTHYQAEQGIKDNKLLWHLPSDLKRFKRLTTGKTVVMGRKTYESIGKPLPNRKNIILTNNKDLIIEGCETINSISELNLLEDIVIIGGEQIYNLFIDYADVIELTLIDKDFEGDAFFPEIDLTKFIKDVDEPMYSDEFNYNYITYKKIH